MGEIHELFVLALSLFWFAGATPEDEKIHLDEVHPFESIICCGVEKNCIFLAKPRQRNSLRSIIFVIPL